MPSPVSLTDSSTNRRWLRRQGIGRATMKLMLDRYGGFHQLMLTADRDAIAFYQALGFERAGRTVPLWIYAGADHPGMNDPASQPWLVLPPATPRWRRTATADTDGVRRAWRGAVPC